MPAPNSTELQALLDEPAGKSPQGVVPTFDSSSLLQNTLAWTCGICVSLSTVVVLIRIYTKLLLSRSRAWEDCKILEWNNESSECLLTMIRCGSAGLDRGDRICHSLHDIEQTWRRSSYLELANEDVLQSVICSICAIPATHCTIC